MIKKTRYYSYKTGKLAKGCKLCVKGRKSVLFATGLCPRDCFFCPISDAKMNNDVVYINELQINELDINLLIIEIKKSRSKGVGITGGDPLSKINRTAGFIKILKEKFGKNFHIHLYTSFNLVTKENIEKLYNVGLDEIRFHADIESDILWKNINIAKQYDWEVGIEIPILPDKEQQLIKILEYFKDKVNFFNFNELEMADNQNVEKFKQHYSIGEDNSYAIKGSLDLGLKLLDYCSKNKLNCHLCSVKLKDKVQLANRIKLRSKSVKLKTDKVTSEGLLKRGVIYSSMVPGLNYEAELFGLNLADAKKELVELNELRIRINKIFDIPLTKLVIDDKNLRILTSVQIAKRIAKNLPEQCAIVLEYPTADQLAVEIELIKP
jgi:pyruvate formate-lyase activating enzyme-like uncharacterized protein